MRGSARGAAFRRCRRRSPPGRGAHRGFASSAGPVRSCLNSAAYSVRRSKSGTSSAARNFCRSPTTIGSPMKAILELVLDRLRRGLLAPGEHDQVLLAVRDGEEAVVDLADVPGVEPALAVDRLGGRLGSVEVALHDGGPRVRISPSSAIFTSMPTPARRSPVAAPGPVDADDRRRLVRP